MQYNNKIIFFSKDLRIGGMEKALVALLNELAKKGYDITLVLENKCGALSDVLNGKITVKEYHLFNFKIAIIRKILNFLHRLFWSLLNYNKYGFSCNFATYSVIGSKLANVASKNSVLYVHSNYSGFFEGDKTKTKDFFKSIDIENFKNVLFVSTDALFAAKEVFPNISDRFTVVNNLVNCDEIIEKSLCSPEEKFDDSKINLLFVGRLDDTSKNFGLLIESFKTAYEKNLDLMLYIIGSGPDKKMIENEIAKHSLDSVILLGEKVNPYPYIKMCDSLILTSKYEGYPIVYAEALVLNKPFITTVAVSDDYIDIRNYFTVTEPYPQTIANEILKISKLEINYNIDFNSANAERIRRIEEIINKRS